MQHGVLLQTRLPRRPHPHGIDSGHSTSTKQNGTLLTVVIRQRRLKLLSECVGPGDAPSCALSPSSPFGSRTPPRAALAMPARRAPRVTPTGERVRRPRKMAFAAGVEIFEARKYIIYLVADKLTVY